MATASNGAELVSAVALLGAAVIAVPIFKRLGLGSVLGYLVAGVAIGPFGLRLFTEPDSILGIAEFGVVLLLFVIGLELKPSRLWSLRRAIFGLGASQVVVCGALLMAAAMLTGLPPATAFVAAAGLALSSTAIVMQILRERGEANDPFGRTTFSILLFQDLAIVPILAAVAFLAPSDPASDASRFTQILIAVAAIGGVVIAGRYLLNPMFRMLAATAAREIMTAAALLVVLGAAFIMQAGGLSMAMGAFMAGVLLSESTFRHQLEADIEPFRGLLLGLFFLGVGMSMDLTAIVANWSIILAVAGGFLGLKFAGIYGVARAFGHHNHEAVRLAGYLAQGGEFAFVIYAAAGMVGLLDTELSVTLTATVVLSMAVNPLVPHLLHWVMPEPEDSLEGIDHAEGLSASALVIGFGRFGQVASQALLARGIDVSLIDKNTEMIRNAWRFGFKIYYGDGARLDVLRAAGAADAKVIAICIDDRAAVNKIAEFAKTEFPLAKVLARSFDRAHTIELVKAGVDYEMRETFESATAFSLAALIALGVDDQEARDIVEDVRKKDLERLQLQLAGDLSSGAELLIGNQPVPEPLTPPRRATQPLSPETDTAARPERKGDRADS